MEHLMHSPGADGPGGAMPDQSDADDPLAMTEAVLAFEKRLLSLPDDVHVQWFGALGTNWQLAVAMPAGEQRRRLMLGVVEDFCGALPDAQRLVDPQARWALWPVPDLHRRLMALALARRPGVLRCSIEREQVQAQRQALGERWAQLRPAALAGSPAVPPEVQAWTALHWSCQGYFDWAELLRRDDAFLRRMVRLTLPLQLMLKVRAQRADAVRGSAEAMVLLRHAEPGGPAC